MDNITQTTFPSMKMFELRLKIVPKGPINNITALVQTVAWRRSGDKPLSETMVVSSLVHICITWSQCAITLVYQVCIWAFVDRYVIGTGHTTVDYIALKTIRYRERNRFARTLNSQDTACIHGGSYRPTFLISSEKNDSKISGMIWNKQAFIGPITHLMCFCRTWSFPRWISERRWKPLSRQNVWNFMRSGRIPMIRYQYTETNAPCVSLFRCRRTKWGFSKLHNAKQAFLYSLKFIMMLRLG